LVQRIISLTTAPARLARLGSLDRLDAALVPPIAVDEPSVREPFEYRDIALLFRAMTDVPVYEAEFRRAGIPFQTVLGKGFYEREEIRDLIQLCRFLDNRTDELALAAVLRSPLGGISDNTLLALRLGPRLGETAPGETPQPRKHPRPLFYAVRKQREIDFIDEDERLALDRAFELLASLIERRHRYPIGDLLRFAVEQSSYTTVIAATYDGAQRLANIEKLYNLAQRFERSGAHLIRDFVKYVHDFEAIGSRESEGQLDDSANAVKLMTIHQAKGLEFPVVIIPDLHRLRPSWEGYFLLDRHRGLTLKVPNGRGQMVSGRTFTLFSERAQWRENFESMRLLYVAATRAQDRLILSGATREISKLVRGNDSWLPLIWQALELGPRWQSSLVELGPETQLQLTVNLVDEEKQTAGQELLDTDAQSIVLSQQLSETFPLLRAIAPERDASVHRLSVTQLINYQRCPRQYYFDRVLHVPTPDQMAVWNNAEAPEPPANLTATLKGAVIHRFCETYTTGNDSEDLLRRSFEDVVRIRQAELADRLVEIKTDEAITDLLPLAQNYLSSAVFERVERARAELAATDPLSGGFSGLWSELSFRLRRPLGILTGAIDKLLITKSASGFDVEIIDFKTNRIRSQRSEVKGQKSEVRKRCSF
jgi:ATP-dependent helicase/nuclease subunit A